MKKNFKLLMDNKNMDRAADSIKHEIRSYIKRERRKPLPEGVDFWDFDCKFSEIEADAKVCHISELTKCIDKAVLEKSPSVYIEILAKPGHRTPKKE